MHHWADIIWSLCGGGAVLAVAVGFANRIAVRRVNPVDANAQALSVLERRFAAGEIDRDEFLERRGYLQLSAERRKELA